MPTNSMPGQKIVRERIRFRRGVPEDVSFIFSSWLKSFRLNGMAENLNPKVYYSQHHCLVEGLMIKANVTVACNPEDPSQIYAYVCHEVIEGLPVVHYIYVKDSFRRLGLAAMLLEEVGISLDKPFFFTHYNKIANRIANRKAMVYNPYLCFYAYKVGAEHKTEAQAEMLRPEPKHE